MIGYCSSMTIQTIETDSSRWVFDSEDRTVVRTSLTGKPHGRTAYINPEGDTYLFDTAGVIVAYPLGVRVIYISGPEIPYGSFRTGSIGDQKFEDILWET